jgi:hypothetical protein
MQGHLHKRPDFLSGQISNALRKQNTTNMSLSREATPLIMHLFHCRRGGLLREGGGTTYESTLYFTFSMHLKSGLIKSVAFCVSDLIKGMTSLEGGNLFVFYFLNAFEIWSDINCPPQARPFLL